MVGDTYPGLPTSSTTTTSTSTPPRPPPPPPSSHHHHLQLLHHSSSSSSSSSSTSTTSQYQPARNYSSSYLSRSQAGMLFVLLLCLLLISQTESSCGGSCGACARRYGCMTAAWGKCCSQFFMHNGRKRSTVKQLPEGMESLIEYVRLKSKIINMATRLPDLAGIEKTIEAKDLGDSAGKTFHLREDSRGEYPIGGSSIEHRKLTIGDPMNGIRNEDSWEDFIDGDVK